VAFFIGAEFVYFAPIMIRYNTKEWFSLIFRFHKSDTFRRLFPAMLLIGLYSGVVAYFEMNVWGITAKTSSALHTLLGMVISLLLVFRTNTAYDRWWEGRKLWGSLVNSSRNLTIKLSAMLKEEQDRKHVALLIALYPEVLKLHLRDQKHPNLDATIHQPNEVARQLYADVYELYEQQKITADDLIVLNNELNTTTDVCGACERIRKTPIPYSYSMFLKKFIFVYVMTMPFGYIKEFGYVVIPVVMFVFYVLVSLEVIAEEIEDPFGEDLNDLPTDDIAAIIRSNVMEIMNIKP
jgi:putative membrane protein